MRFLAYITEQGRKNAVHFKYKGSDHSILFNKFLNPYVFNNVRAEMNLTANTRPGAQALRIHS